MFYIRIHKYIFVTVERELKQLDDRLVKLLAYQRVQQLLVQRGAGGGYLRGASPLTVAGCSSAQQQSRPKYMPLPSELLTPADIDRISRVFSSPKRRSRLRSNVRARAMLCPVVSKHFYNVRTSEVRRGVCCFYRPTLRTFLFCWLG